MPGFSKVSCVAALAATAIVVDTDNHMFADALRVNMFSRLTNRFQKKSNAIDSKALQASDEMDVARKESEPAKKLTEAEKKYQRAFATGDLTDAIVQRNGGKNYIVAMLAAGFQLNEFVLYKFGEIGAAQQLQEIKI